MKTIIYYYTGTGNSLWTSRRIAAELGNTTLISMSQMSKGIAVEPGVEAIGLVFPVHIWGVPKLVLDFLKTIQPDPGKYYFAFAVNGGQVSRTLIQLQKYMADLGFKLSSGVNIVLPSNYIPWGGPGPLEKLEKLYSTAENKIMSVIPALAGKEIRAVERGPLWQRLVFTVLYKLTFNLVQKLDKNFWIDEKCNGCGICEKTCPTGNIVMTSGKPEWLHQCEQCLACLQWCPQEAIQYGKKTPLYERYHHPQVQLRDMIKDSRTREDQ